LGRWEYRYWDGQYWTANVSRAGVAGQDPLPSPPIADSTTVAGVTAELTPKPQGFLARRSAERAAKKAERAAKKADRQALEALTIRAARGDQSALAELPDAISKARGLWRGFVFDMKLTNVLVQAIHDVMSDDLVTDDEARRLDAIANAIGIPISALAARAPGAFEQLQIGLINAGNPPQLDDPGIILQGAKSPISPSPPRS
jgi:hypothetical protein